MRRISSVLFGLTFSVFAAVAGHTQQLEPGVAAPSRGTVYLAESGDPAGTLTEVHAHQITSDSQAGSNFARSMVYAGPHASVDLDGTHAEVNSGPAPSIFVRVGDDNPDLMTQMTELLRLKVKGDRRVVSSYSQNIFGGSHKRHEDVVDATKTPVPGAPSWIRLTLPGPLEPGEYGIAQVPKDPNSFPNLIYDFSVSK